jgi:hypothetical protein
VRASGGGAQELQPMRQRLQGMAHRVTGSLRSSMEFRRVAAASLFHALLCDKLAAIAGELLPLRQTRRCPSRHVPFIVCTCRSVRSHSQLFQTLDLDSVLETYYIPPPPPPPLPSPPPPPLHLPLPCLIRGVFLHPPQLQRTPAADDAAQAESKQPLTCGV